MTVRQDVIKTVRLDRRLEARLRRAARATDRTGSELIRDAVERECDTVLSGRADDPLADLIGSVRGDGSGYGARAHQAFGEALMEELRLKEMRRRRRR